MLTALVSRDEKCVTVILKARYS